MRARIVVVKSNPSSAVGFPDFLEDNWQTNGCVALRIDDRAVSWQIGTLGLPSTEIKISVHNMIDDFD